jgi:membrane fusion protein (multidrug efflux system)
MGKETPDISAAADRAGHSDSAPVKPVDSHRSQAAEPATPVLTAMPVRSEPASHSWRLWVFLGIGLIVLAVLALVGVPWLLTALNTVSTDDAYVNGHVTFVAPRVAGQVMKVFVDDNYRVKKGDVLVQLDKEPYQVQLDIKQAAVTAAKSDLEAAKAQVQALVAQTRANKFKLDHAMEDVRNQVANLSANVASLKSKQASLELALANLKRGDDLVSSGGISKEDLDQRKQQVKVSQAAVDQALQTVYANRVSLGLPEKPEKGDDLTQVPPDLDQNFSTVRQAMGALQQSAAQLGYFPAKWDATPKETIDAFLKQDPEPNKDPHGRVDRIYAKIIPQAPARKQAEAKLEQAQRDLDQAKLNLRYCDVVSEIDGVVTSRNVNPGNNVLVGQNLMAVRSLTEIWIDANFKETQLANLRIGQRVRCEVDMYGSRREFEGRITGFTYGTGQTLSLLPPQNATGNYVKIVQRLPVRIELTDYDANKESFPLFYGLSVEPYVYYKERPEGPNAGDFLQPLADLPKGPTQPKP